MQVSLEAGGPYACLDWRRLRVMEGKIHAPEGGAPACTARVASGRVRTYHLGRHTVAHAVNPAQPSRRRGPTISHPCPFPHGGPR